MFKRSLWEAVTGLADTFVGRRFETLRPPALRDDYPREPTIAEGKAPDAKLDSRPSEEVVEAVAEVWEPAARVDPIEAEPPPPPTRTQEAFVVLERVEPVVVEAPIDPFDSEGPWIGSSVEVVTSGQAEEGAEAVGESAAPERDPALVMADRIVELLRANPRGLRAEEMKVMLQVDRELLKLGIAEVLKTKRVGKEGLRRATTYYSRE